MIAAADVDDVLAVRRDADAREFLSVVERVRRQLSRLVVWRIGDPDVATSLLVERPCESSALRGCGQLVGEWIALDLIDGERLRLALIASMTVSAKTLRIECMVSLRGWRPS